MHVPTRHQRTLRGGRDRLEVGREGEGRGGGWGLVIGQGLVIDELLISGRVLPNIIEFVCMFFSQLYF